MIKKSLLLAPLAALAIPSSALASSGVECHPDSKKLEWYVCVVKPVEYKRGMKTETRDECAINNKLDIKDCNLGNLLSHLPPGEDIGQTYFYAIGPASFDDTQWESQEESEDQGCSVKSTRLESFRLTRFSDAFDKSNRERGSDYDDKLKAAGKMLLPGGTLAPRIFPGSKCEGKKAAAGKMDAKTLSKFLFYTESVFPAAAGGD
jgi:hypothetical protein